MAKASSSKINLWRRCRRKAWYHDVLKLKRKTQRIAPVRGTIIHECLQRYYNGEDWTTPINNLKIDLDNVFDEEREMWLNLQSELYRIVRNYIASYRDIDAGIKTLATEKQFAIPLGDNHTYMGTIDWIYQDNEGIWVADHKTVKQMPNREDLYTDLQTMMYFDVLNHLEEFKGLPIRGIVFNHIRTKAPTTPKLLKSGALSKDKRIDTDVITYVSEIRRHGLNIDDYKDMIEHLKNNVFYKRIKIPTREQTLNIIRDEIITTMDEIDFYTSKAKQYGNDASKLFTRTLVKGRCSWDCEYHSLCTAELLGTANEAILDEYEEREDRYDD